MQIKQLSGVRIRTRLDPILAVSLDSVVVFYVANIVYIHENRRFPRLSSINTRVFAVLISRILYKIMQISKSHVRYKRVKRARARQIIRSLVRFDGCNFDGPCGVY